jgi:hypothetical protein
VDIHRKPGYDPVELFLDPALSFPRAKIAWRLLQKRLGFRTLMDVIPLDPCLVKGSHGLRPSDPKDFPIVISRQAELIPDGSMPATAVYEMIRNHVVGQPFQQ